MIRAIRHWLWVEYWLWQTRRHSKTCSLCRGAEEEGEAVSYSDAIEETRERLVAHDRKKPLFALIEQNMLHQERRYGTFTNDVAGMRLGLACLEDELAECLEAWRGERRGDGWLETHAELMQLVAVACRLLMDTGLPESSIAWPEGRERVAPGPKVVDGEG